jgi:CheY-like chemotaxis protein
LSFYGAKVYTAQDGVEGLRILQTVTPTFILLDLSMPHMDGWEMLKELRKDPRWSHIPVIALTAHAMTGDRDRVLDAGFDDYIAKPFHLTTFIEDIRRCLRAAGHLPVAE